MAYDNFSAPKKALGQNFLQDANIIRKIVESVGIRADDTIVEIGPGRGALTDQVLALSNHCHIIEFDRELVSFWQKRAVVSTNLVVHDSDILKFDMTELLAQSTRPIKVIGNLPYNISSPVLFHLMQYAEYLDSQTVMLQKEVVDRMVSGPGSKLYGRLSVMLQQRYRIERLFNVPRTAFFPPPKVESAIVQLTPLSVSDSSIGLVEDQLLFAKVVKQAFSQRRKTLRNTLKGLLNSEQMESLGIDSKARAETLDVNSFVRLANLLKQVDC